jgi:uncharacterized protein YacL (UPF0231 family)
MSATISYFDTLSEKELDEYVNGQQEVTLYFDNEEAGLKDDWLLNEAENRMEYYADYYTYDYEPSLCVI